MVDAANQVSSEPLVAACRLQRVPWTPVWFMRQAGRSLPEYRALRRDGSILEAVRQPELVAELTLQPVRRHRTDAAVLFSDIMVPLAAVVDGVEILAGRGPVVDPPFRTEADLRRLRPLEPDEDLLYVAEAARRAVAELGPIPLVGFAGGPFTLASYLVEGGASRAQARTKTLMRSDPTTWHALAEALVDIAAGFLELQVRSGASVIQVFDSWIGELSPSDYRRFVLPHSRALFERLGGLGVARIHFGVGTSSLLEAMAEAGAEVIGLDWRTPLDEARARLGPGVAVQGNLDPTVLLSPWEVVREAAMDILRRNQGRPGHIFNLGHGVLPETDPDQLTRLVELVHEQSSSPGRLGDPPAVQAPSPERAR